VEDDYHFPGPQDGRRVSARRRWRVIDLGNDVSPADFVAAALEHGARVIGVSAMMLTTAENIRAVRAEIDARGLKGKVLLAVGGAVFKLRPELMHESGGTARQPAPFRLQPF
jgi:Predicted cobalamin binding protein